LLFPLAAPATPAGRVKRRATASSASTDINQPLAAPPPPLGPGLAEDEEPELEELLEELLLEDELDDEELDELEEEDDELELLDDEALCTVIVTPVE